jgi:ABC-type transport system involved in multi-copper enzyme maturation permease subunit
MQPILRWLWQLGPANPMTLRIVATASRRLPHLWLRSAFLGLMILLLMYALLSGGAFSTTGDAGQLAAAGSRLFAIVAYGQLLLLCLLTPVLLGAALSSERSGRTLEVLLTTPMSNLQIVLGSLAGRLFFLIALLASSIPLMAVVRLLGGVRGESILVAYIVAGLLVYFLGAVAVALSAWRVGGRGAVLFFVVGIGGYLILLYGVDLWLRRLDPGSTTWLTPLHPMLVLTASVSPATYRTPAPADLTSLPTPLAWYLTNPLTVFTLLTAGLGSLLLLTSALTLRSGLLQRARRAARRSRASVKVWNNPVAWRECQRLAGGWLTRLARLLVPATCLLIIATLLTLHANDTLAPAPSANAPNTLASHLIIQQVTLLLVMLQASLGLLMGVFYGSATIAREREDGTLDLLLTTPIGARAYLWGKVRGLLSGLLPLTLGAILTLALPAAYSLLGSSLDWSSATYTVTSAIGAAGSVTRDVPLVLPEAPLGFALSYLPLLAAAITIGLGRSIVSRNVITALLPTLIVVLGLLGLSAVIGLQAASNIPQFGVLINAINPLTHLVVLIDPWTHGERFIDYPVTGRVALGLGSLLAAAGYSVFVYGRMSLTLTGFDHAVRQSKATG